MSKATKQKGRCGLFIVCHVVVPHFSARLLGNIFVLFYVCLSISLLPGIGRLRIEVCMAL